MLQRHRTDQSAMMMVLRLGVLLLLAVAAVWLAMHRQMIELASLEPTLRALGIWAPVGFIAIYAVGTVLFFSGALLSLAGGSLFGPVWGMLWNLLGATLGATIAFLLARSIAGPWAARRLGQRLPRLVDGVSAEGWRFVAIMRLVPLVPFNLLNYALGLTVISLPVYVVTSFVCMLPGRSPLPGLVTPAARLPRAICRRCVMGCLVSECLPSELKILGLPNRASASPRASTQNPAVSVFDSRQRTRRVAQSMIATKYRNP
jgi:uncharacterized membrane protein YdjX (TVP38/TMEM64 family)